MIYINYENKVFSKQIEYVFNTIFFFIGIKIKFIEDLNINICHKDLIINYSNEVIYRKNTINIKPSYLFSEQYLMMKSMPKVPLKKHRNFPVIYLNEDDNNNCYLGKSNNYLITNIDIIQSSFFMLTRYEEVLLWDKIERDFYGRFPAKESLAYKEDFLDLPIVNEYIEWLWQWIDSFNLGYKRRSLWGQYNFVTCLTHDVDMPFKYIYSLKRDIQNLKVKRASLAYREIFLHALSRIDYKKDPFYTFDYIREVEDQYRFTSSFYFMTGGTSNYENFYSIDDERVVELMNILYSQNCEVGYHCSFNSYNDFYQRKKEKNLLDKYIPDKTYGGRNHYLRFKVPESWSISEKVGLKYDTTLGYAEVPGFRCGICYPYKVFDILENKELDLWEIPLILMEASLKGEEYMNLNPDDAVKVAKKIIDTVKRYKGVFTLLWHNSSFDKEEWDEWKNGYECIIKYIFLNNSLGLSGEKILAMFNSYD
ncbi:hypothetical protein FDA95_08875 [Clostridium botulinum]|uniref:polysaccharide deacetylase family protein n=1 Tax=Clostridium botulinum TaxID=1491 RepID=UPI0013FB7C37|nr:polysaccharide deacetylase family protein [Clostridium botulinum]NFK78714.1 hypothetical protein [Clostridium botulinum]BDB02545.1 hypothetical protein CBOS2020_26190 [Clostridium botulinum]